MTDDLNLEPTPIEETVRAIVLDKEHRAGAIIFPPIRLVLSPDADPAQAEDLCGKDVADQFRAILASLEESKENE